MRLFNTTKHQFGQDTYVKMKHIFNNKKKLASMLNRRIFLLRCRTNNIFPNHIVHSIKNIESLLCDTNHYQRKISNILHKFKKSILNIEIQITEEKIRHLIKVIQRDSNSIKACIPQHVFNDIMLKSDQHQSTIFSSIKTTNIKKFNKLTTKHLPSKVEEHKENTIANYTNTVIPEEVKSLLNLGPKFGLPVENKTKIIPILIKDIEYAINSQPISDTLKDNKRAKAVNVITNYINKPNNNRKSALYKAISKTKNFIKSHDNIIISQSDKGRTTTIMEKNEYLQDIRNMLDNDPIYNVTNKDPTTKFQNKTNTLIEKMIKNSHITSNEGRSLKRHNSVPPKLYCLRKTHKKEKSYRPIVNCRNTHSYNLAKFIHNKLSPIMTTSKYNVKNSFDLIHIINNTTLPENYELISLDVKSLFTNIPKDLVMEIIKKKWKFIEAYTEIPKVEILHIIEHIYNTSYFSFDGKIYKQLDGTAMGNPLSPLLANLVMNDLIDTCVQKIHFDIPLLQLYVDDTILAIPKDAHDVILDCFNNYHMKLKFTIERENNKTIPFLDVLVIREESGNLKTKWYSKPENSGVILNYKSHHPIQQKIATATGLIKRALRLSHKEYHKEEYKKIKAILSKNNYPVYLIKKLYIKCQNTTARIKNNTDIVYYKLPYIESFTGPLNKCIQQPNYSIAPYNINTSAKSFFTDLKDKTDIKDQSSVVYKIPCGNCDRNYIGQTRQKLDKRIQQHKYDCQSLDKHKTALSLHHYETGHIFNFKNCSILEKEENQLKRNVAEMVHIYTNPTVNLREDTNHLSRIYSGLLHRMIEEKK